MIISHKHKFIFIKNRKVAGTSIEMALARICGPDDVLTNGVPERNRIGQNDVLAAHARNFEGGFNAFNEIALDLRPTSVARVLRDRAKRHCYYNHMRASSVKARLGSDLWEEYYTFCFERNPWDKMISFYFWYNRSTQKPRPIDDFICGRMQGATLDQKYPTDWERYTLGNRMIVDDVFDYNDLAGNFSTALARAGVDATTIEDLSLPRMKAGVRSGDPVRLSRRSDEVIRGVFAREIEQFGYTCPEGFLG